MSKAGKPGSMGVHMSIGESEWAADAPNTHELWSTPARQPKLVRQVKSRLIGSELRSRLRARPGLQGRVLAPAGTFRRLPRTPALYFPFYHDVPPQYAARLRQHLRTFGQVGRFVSWDEALGLLATGEKLDRPMFCLSFDDCDRYWVDVLMPILESLRIPAMFFVITEQVTRGDKLTWADCRDMAGAGMRFGSHTRTHQRLLD